MARTMPAGKVCQRLSASNYVEVYAYSKAWPCLFAQHGAGKKHERQTFSNASQDIRGIFCDACDLLDVHYTCAPRTVYVSRKDDVDRLDRFIRPKR